MCLHQSTALMVSNGDSQIMLIHTETARGLAICLAYSARRLNSVAAVWSWWFLLATRSCKQHTQSHVHVEVIHKMHILVLTIVNTYTYTKIVSKRLDLCCGEKGASSFEKSRKSKCSLTMFPVILYSIPDLPSLKQNKLQYQNPKGPDGTIAKQ